MFHVTTTSSNLPAVYERGLNGLFGKFLMGLANFVVNALESVPIVGSHLKKGMGKALAYLMNAQFNGEEIIGGGTFLNKSVNEEPSLADQVIIKPWTENYLAPYIKSLAQQLATAFGSADFNYQLAQINDVMQKMCVVREYFLTNETKGLSALGIAARKDLIDLLFTEVEKLIDDSAMQYAFIITKEKVSFVATADNIAQFRPLISTITKGTTFSCMKYVSTSAPNTQTMGPTKTSTLEIVEDIPATPATTTIFTKKNVTIGLIAGTVLCWALWPKNKQNN